MPKAASISISTDELTIASIDSKTKDVHIEFDEHAKMTKAYVMKNITSTLDRLKDLVGIGVASTGILDQNKGIIKYGSMLEIRNLKIVDVLEEKYKIPVSLYQLGVASVLAEKLFGIGAKYKDIVYISISNLIRSGVIIGNQLLMGKDGNAHQVGHMAVSSEGKLRCFCGSYGHWDAYCSGYGIPNYVRYLLRTKYAKESTFLKKQKKISAKDLFALAKTDAVARRIVRDDIGTLNAIGVANAINAYDPEIVIFGGIIAKSNPELILKPIEEKVDNYLINRKPKFAMSKWKFEGKLLGAASDFLQQERGTGIS
ncbi:MAG: ROK family protein [Candidatus Micrarchaeia archaeon]